MKTKKENEDDDEEEEQPKKPASKPQPVASSVSATLKPKEPESAPKSQSPATAGVKTDTIPVPTQPTHHKSPSPNHGGKPEASGLFGALPKPTGSSDNGGLFGPKTTAAPPKAKNPLFG